MSSSLDSIADLAIPDVEDFARVVRCEDYKSKELDCLCEEEVGPAIDLHELFVMIREFQADLKAYEKQSSDELLRCYQEKSGDMNAGVEKWRESDFKEHSPGNLNFYISHCMKDRFFFSLVGICVRSEESMAEARSYIATFKKEYEKRKDEYDKCKRIADGALLVSKRIFAKLQSIRGYLDSFDALPEDTLVNLSSEFLPGAGGEKKCAGGLVESLYSTLYQYKWTINNYYHLFKSITGLYKRRCDDLTHTQHAWLSLADIYSDAVSVAEVVRNPNRSKGDVACAEMLIKLQSRDF